MIIWGTRRLREQVTGYRFTREQAAGNREQVTGDRGQVTERIEFAPWSVPDGRVPLPYDLSPVTYNLQSLNLQALGIERSLDELRYHFILHRALIEYTAWLPRPKT